MQDVTNEQIKALAIEANAAGDRATVALCKRALGKKPGAGDASARAECARVIADARAMDDDR